MTRPEGRHLAMGAGLRIVDDTSDGTADGTDADGDGDEQDEDRKNNHDGNDVEGAILDFWVHAL
jgi:hypothetical protein